MTLKDSLSKNKAVALASALLVLYFAVNSFTLFHRDIFVDEAISYSIANKVSWKELFSGIDVHPPTYYTILKILPHTNFYYLRFYSLIVMEIALIILFITVKRLFFSTKTALMVLFMAVMSATISEYGTQARMYSLLFLLSVLIVYNMVKKNYNTSILLICVCVSLHYYSVFLAVPFVSALMYDKKIFWRYALRLGLCMAITLGILSPLFFNQQFGDNPYKIPPPSEWTSLSSLPSMIIFPFIIPSSIQSLLIYVIGLLLIVMMLYLMVTFLHEDRSTYLFFIVSCLTTFIMFSLSYLRFPYHHRYTIIFFPIIYITIACSIQNKINAVRKLAYAVFVVFIVIGFWQYHTHPENQFIEISSEIKCPQNILHESPFSYLPMSIYLPDCNHYFGTSKDWLMVSGNTLYTTDDKINNDGISYDIYIHYFTDLKNPDLLSSTDMTTLRLIKIRE